MRERRNALLDEDIRLLSIQISERLIRSTIYNEAVHICIYEAFRNEVSCEYIKKKAFQDGKRVYIPVTDEITKTMDFYEITENTFYIEGNYGIKEPVFHENSNILQEKALILMPGLAFDRNKHRLGYGGGYYDKYLAIHSEHVTAALCYNFQIVDELPSEKHDILPNYIVTESESF